jgi:hypothetical protein
LNSSTIQQRNEHWVGNNDSIPEQLQRLSGVNTSDPEQRRQHLFPLFHRNLAVVNFFLLNVVFPKQAKEFPEKMSTSGWDLAENKRNYTTGFSGTNDNRYLLPTSIIQDDPAGRLSTNAKVLTFILQPENNRSSPPRSTSSWTNVLCTWTMHIREVQT